MAGEISEGEHHWVVAKEEAGMRLDRWLVHKLSQLGRSGARALISSGRVQVDGRSRPKGKGLPLRAGQRVVLLAPPPSHPVPAAELMLPILYEDAHLVAVNKPAGMPSHPLVPGERGTVVNALLARYPEMREVGYRPREAGLVHRLDNDTSGVLLAARNSRTFAALRQALLQHTLDKCYLALCLGQPIEGMVFREKVVHDRARPKRVRVCDEPGTSATEILRVEPRGGAYALVEVRATRARRHQVRAHLAAHGFPLAGDPTYGGPVLPGLTRHFLHASKVRLAHPHTGAPLVVEAPLADDLACLLKTLPLEA